MTPLLRSDNLLSIAAGSARDFTWKSGVNQVLIGVNLEEQDSYWDFPFADAGSIWIQDVTGANSISLAHGGLEAGQIGGWGCVPLKVGDEIKGRLWHMRDANRGKLNVHVISYAEAKELGLTPCWTSKTAKATHQLGTPKTLLIDGTAAATTKECVPDTGYIWQIMDLWAYHDDPATPTLTWSWRDSYNGYNEKKPASGALAINAHWPLIVAGDVPYSPIIIDSRYCQLRVTASAMAAGKKIYIRGAVLEYGEV